MEKGTVRIRFRLGQVLPGLVSLCLFSLVSCASQGHGQAKVVAQQDKPQVVSGSLSDENALLEPWQGSVVIPENVIFFSEHPRDDTAAADYARLVPVEQFALPEIDLGDTRLTNQRAMEAAVDDNVFEVMDDRLSRPRTTQSRWYIFAGSGGDTLTYEPGGRSFGDGWRVENKTIVGDGQAGLAMRLGPANLALGYVRREFSAHSRLNDLRGNEVESYAAFSLSFGH